MKNLTKTALLCVSLCLPGIQSVHAMGSRAPSSGQSNQQNALIDFGLNLAIVYAKTDPRYSAILTALGINNAQDIRNFLKGNSDGSNFQNIISRLVMIQAAKNPKVSSLLSQLGINNETELREFLKNGQGGINYEALLAVALAEAQNNPKYAQWLQRLNINSVTDIRNLIGGFGNGGNLQAMVISIALNYVQSNPKYSKYAPYIQLAASMLGLSIPNSSSTLDLGAFAGMNVGEIVAIQKLK